MGKLINFYIKFTRLGFENACWIARQASRCQQAFSKPCLINLISKDTHLVFSISRQASRCQQALRCQQAFSKPCLVNLISKDTHLVFSISRQASWCQQAFSKFCLVNLISKDTHLVFSITRFASFNIKFTRLGFENACWIAQQASRCQQAFSKHSPSILNLLTCRIFQTYCPSVLQCM